MRRCYLKRVIVIVICSLIFFVGCGKKEDAERESVTENTEELQKITEEEGFYSEVDLSNMAINPLTGLYIVKEAASRRPVAVMINNLHKALPQSGIGQADILYEALAEGEITRIEAIYQDFDAEKIGPVRSARDYFTYFALDNDAIYVHHGGSEGGYLAIRKRGVDNIDGMVDSAFWRDKTRVNQPGMYEHSSYTNAEKILESWDNRGYRKNKEEGSKPMLLFNNEDSIIENGLQASRVVIPYSGYQVSEFKYNNETKEYERYQSGMPHIDELTGQCITVKNVLIQIAPTKVIDSAGRRSIGLVGSGKGYYITNGKAENITWNKSNGTSTTQWFHESGNELRVNKGKTFICIYSEGGTEIIME